MQPYIGMVVERYNLVVRDVLPLERFGDYEKLRIYLVKGTTCVTCGTSAKYLLETKPSNKLNEDLSLYNLYDENFIMLTKDHVIPRCKGGKNNLNNIVTMCELCNGKKGSKLDSSIKIEGDQYRVVLMRCGKKQSKNLDRRVYKVRRRIRKYINIGHKLMPYNEPLLMAIDPINQIKEIHFNKILET